MKKLAILLRRDFKRLLKDDNFWNFFPEYSSLHKRIANREIRLGCCSMPEEFYNELIKMVLDNLPKWKLFLKVDQIQLYHGNPKRAVLY